MEDFVVDGRRSTLYESLIPKFNEATQRAPCLFCEEDFYEARVINSAGKEAATFGWVARCAFELKIGCFLRADLFQTSANFEVPSLANLYRWKIKSRAFFGGGNTSNVEM